ncbi:COP9 signalosome subunit 8 [Cochliomyia hominivorax]
MKQYDAQIEMLENEELELATSNCSLYIKLMAYYLVQNKLFDAKFLWSRISQSIKSDNSELKKLNELLHSLIFNNLADVIKNIDNNEWCEEIKTVINDLRDATMQNIFQMIGNAYTSILDKTFIKLTNLREDQCEQKCKDLGWTLESYDQQTVIHPQKPAATNYNIVESEYQLSKLTEFVSFLEN